MNSFHLNLTTTYEANTVVTYTLQMEKLKFRKIYRIGKYPSIKWLKQTKINIYVTVKVCF